MLAVVVTIVPPTVADDVVGQLQYCGNRRDRILRRLGPIIHGIAVSVVTSIDVDRDRTLHIIRQQYATVGIANDIPNAVIQASQLAAQFGDRKRANCAIGIGQVRDQVVQALQDITSACGNGQTQAVLNNAHGRVLRKFAAAVEVIRSYVEAIIAYTIREVCDVGRRALKLNDRALTTQRCQRGALQRRLNVDVQQTIGKIVQFFDVNDAKIYDTLDLFAVYAQQAEDPRQAWIDYLNDNSRCR